ncbi:KTSC domain-containing protein [Sodalis ligni]|nr:KTSC domain-containing protein [Sodalis ligni]
MERQRVVSEEIQSVGYDVAHRMLEIKFQTIGVYQYPGFL